VHPTCTKHRPAAGSRGLERSRAGSGEMIQLATFSQLTDTNSLMMMMGGQGRGRTADLPLFRRTLVPTELPDLGDVALGATSAVLTGFEPATSTLTGWRALHAALQDHLLPPTLADDAPRGGSARGNPCARRAYHRNARGRVQLSAQLSRRGRHLL
jgi:hypothetical protein